MDIAILENYECQGIQKLDFNTSSNLKLSTKWWWWRRRWQWHGNDDHDDDDDNDDDDGDDDDDDEDAHVLQICSIFQLITGASYKRPFSHDDHDDVNVDNVGLMNGWSVWLRWIVRGLNL